MLWINFLNDKVLHTKDGRYTPARELVQYYAAAFNSTMTMSDQRRHYCRKLQLIGEDLKYTKAIKEADLRAQERLLAVPDNVFAELIPIQP